MSFSNKIPIISVPPPVSFYDQLSSYAAMGYPPPQFQGLPPPPAPHRKLFYANIIEV